MSKEKCCKKTSIGGQALIEGIMMRGPHKTVMSVRKNDGQIVSENLNTTSLKDKCGFFGLPIIRGSVSMVESLVFGYKALMRSADLSGMLEEEEAEKKAKADKKADKNAKAEEAWEAESESVAETVVDVSETTAELDEVVTDADETTDDETDADEITADEIIADKTTADETAESAPDEVAADGETDYVVEASAEADAPIEKKTEKKSENGILMAIIGAISMVFGIALALALFFYLPSLIFKYVNHLAGGQMTSYQAAFEGVLKIIIFVIYLILVSQMKDIKRVFMYHGAEHKTIFCYEHGNELTVENVRKEKRFHPRCGTSFLILMLIVSIIFYMIIARIFPDLASNIVLWMLIRIACLPLLVGVGFELIKFCGRHDNFVTKIISAPGVWLQRITTKEPDDSMIEVAIEAMTAVIPENSEDDRW
ncbi:MAG: DUF1385 domain-containing protein [Clostridia bacterium]|nr:DUF1385 domain-containing protein [Clostridia bacterium]